MDEHHMPGDSGIHSAAVSEQSSPGLVLPKWFLILASGFMGMMATTFVPWSIWVTWTLINYITIRDARGEVLAEDRQRIVALEQSRENHALQLQAISSTRFTAEQANALNSSTLAEIRAVSAKLETKIEALQRDFDRSFAKPKGITLTPEEIETVGE